MTTATRVLTIHLPEPFARRLDRVAEISKRPVDEVIAATLNASLPPLLEDVPAAFRADLASLEQLSSDALRKQMNAKLSPELERRYDDLLAKNAAGQLDAAESQSLDNLRMEADRLMYRKAYAALLLKWRGYRIPTSTELEAQA